MSLYNISAVVFIPHVKTVNGPLEACSAYPGPFMTLHHRPTSQIRDFPFRLYWIEAPQTMATCFVALHNDTFECSQDTRWRQPGRRHYLFGAGRCGTVHTTASFEHDRESGLLGLDNEIE